MKSAINRALRYLPAWALYPLFLVPGVWLLVGQIFAPSPNPVEALEHGLGEYALQLLILGLFITPLRDVVGVNLVRYRRAVGVMAFVYVLAHLVVYLWLDRQWEWDALVKDFTKRPYIIVGMVSFVILVPLALTSNNLSIRRLGAATWQRIHWLVYPAVILGAAHYLLLAKTWQLEPMLYTALAVALVAWRLPKLVRGLPVIRRAAS